MFKRLAHLIYRINDLENVSAETTSFLGRRESALQHQNGNFRVPEGYDTGLDLSTGGHWQAIGGTKGSHSWSPGVFKRSRAIAVWDNSLIVGLDGGVEGKAEIYEYDGTRWELIGGHGINGSWEHGVEVNSAAVHDGLLFAGISSHITGPQVWAYDKKAWRLVAPCDGVVWGPDNYFSVSAMASDGERLIVGLQNHKRRDFQGAGGIDQESIAPVYQLQNDKWSKIGDGSTWGGNKDYLCAYDIHIHSDGCAYIGFFGEDDGNGDIWKLDGGSFDRIAGAGLNDSWVSSAHVLRIRSWGDNLVALMNRQPMAPGDFSLIWAFEAGKWMPIGLGGIPHEWGKMSSFNAIGVYKTRLIVGAGGRPPGKASVWFLDDEGKWKCFGGQGRLGSWSPKIRRSLFKPMARRTGAEYVYQFTEFNGKLIVGFGASPGCAQIWSYDPQ